MSSFQKKREEAQENWDLLKTSEIPVLYLGTASCGRAAGALAVLEAMQKTLEKKGS